MSMFRGLVWIVWLIILLVIGQWIKELFDWVIVNIFRVVMEV